MDPISMQNPAYAQMQSQPAKMSNAMQEQFARIKAQQDMLTVQSRASSMEGLQRAREVSAGMLVQPDSLIQAQAIKEYKPHGPEQRGF